MHDFQSRRHGNAIIQYELKFDQHSSNGSSRINFFPFWREKNVRIVFPDFFFFFLLPRIISDFCLSRFLSSFEK